MGYGPDWWRRPRRISVLVDNESWVLPYAEAFVRSVNLDGDEAVLVRSAEDVPAGDICFLLGCVCIVPAHVLKRNRHNLLVHESDLPKGRGFAPVTWQILEGQSTIPVVLLEATAEVDAGPIYLRHDIQLEGHELCDEIRALQGQKTVEICLTFLRCDEPPQRTPQTGSGAFNRRRRPNDSRLDPERTISDQFDLLRTVDNNRYPAFFEFRGHRYRLLIEKDVWVENGK